MENKYTRSQLLELLRSGHNIIVKFKKSDGTERSMLSTLNVNIIPDNFWPKGGNVDFIDSADSKPVAEKSENNLIVFDIEKQGWRCFKIDSVLEVSRNGAFVPPVAIS